MPLVRVEVRNEFGLGLPELYKEANREDPKAVLDGVAVAGLVGILRQLGDLAEFAAEVFHGLQEQVMITSSRSHKLMVRVQNIEAELPPLEKAILAQRSHLHFAYTAGSHWHTHVRSEQNHFIHGDLPRFIMDAYEECRCPPRLHLLDKFDTSGPGACLKRYSDPTFFKRASTGSNEANMEKVPTDKKARRSKKKRTWQRSGEVPHGVPISSHSGRMQFASPNFDGQSSPCHTVSKFDATVKQTQFASPNFDGQSSSCHTVSTFDATLKHELGDQSNSFDLSSPSHTPSTFDATLKHELGGQSNSFDLRTGSGYIECVFRHSYAMQSEEHESKEFSSSRLKMHHNHTLDSDSLVEQSGVVDADIQNSLSRDQTGPSSSCVTWDEKAAIMEPTGQQCDNDETKEILHANIDLDTQEGGFVNFRSVDQMDLHFDNEDMPTSVSGGNQVDDIESETDNYMDALNTIESECETDLDCQTKREVEQYSTLNNKAIEDEMHPSNFESHVPDYISSHKTMPGHNPNLVSSESHTTAYSSSNNGISGYKPNSVSSECYANAESPQMAGKFLIPDTSPDIGLCGIADILDGSQIEAVVSNASSSGSREPNLQSPVSKMIIGSPCESQKSPPVSSGVHSVMFWTNGGLLGLEPSKPPDFSGLNAVSQDSLAETKAEIIRPSSQSNILKDGHALKSDLVVKSSKLIEQGPSSECSTSCHNDQEDGVSFKKTSWKFSPSDLDVKLVQSSDFHPNNSLKHSHRQGFNEINIMTPGTEWPDSLNVQATKASKGDGKNSSRVFEFSNRLLANGFRRQVSLVEDDNPASSVKSGVSEQKSTPQAYQTFSGRTFHEKFGSGSPVMSPCSSPPLEHMRISFQPIVGSETSKLKLKFPDGSNYRESTGDLFPSFQLVPEPSISQHDIGSDSDDDTFCRSSPYRSHDCLSYHTESNSDQWESDDSPRNEDHELYNDLYKTSTTESFLSSMEIGGTAQGVIPDNCGLQSPFAEDAPEPFHSGRLLDLPSFDTVSPSFKQGLVNVSDANYLLESHFPKEPAPPLPPLPPLQWRGMKPHPDMETEKQNALSEALKYTFDLKLSESTISQQHKPAPVKQDQNIEAIAYTSKSKQPDWQNLNWQKEANQTTNGKVMDEKEDFLHQIRTKSFNLKRTATARPIFTPGAPTNVKVTAILEKANAIRQAVGSDDGEDDDNWSET